MAIQQMSTELRDALKREGMKEDQLDLCGAQLADKCDVYTVKEFVGYFGADQQFLVEFWKSKSRMERQRINPGLLLQHSERFAKRRAEVQERERYAPRCHTGQSHRPADQ